MKIKIKFTQKELDQLVDVLFDVCLKLKGEYRQKHIRELAANSLNKPTQYFNATTSHHEGIGNFGEWKYSLYEVSEIYNYFCSKVRGQIDIPKGLLSDFSNQMLIREVQKSKVENLKKFIQKNSAVQTNIFTDLKMCLKYLEISAHFAQASESKAALKMKRKSSLTPGFIDLVFFELKNKEIFENQDFNWDNFLFFITSDFLRLKESWPDFFKCVRSRFADEIDLIQLIPSRSDILAELQLHLNTVFTFGSVNLKPTEIESLKDRMSKRRLRATDK